MWHALEGLCFALSMVAIYAVRCVTACISAFSSPPCHTQQCTAHSRLPVETRVMLSAGFSRRIKRVLAPVPIGHPLPACGYRRSRPNADVTTSAMRLAPGNIPVWLPLCPSARRTPRCELDNGASGRRCAWLPAPRRHATRGGRDGRDDRARDEAKFRLGAMREARRRPKS